MKIARGLLAGVLGLAALLAACGPDEPIGVHARFGVLPQSLDACPTEAVPKSNYVDEVDLFRLKLTASGLQPQRKDFNASDAKSSSSLQLDGVPAGDGRNLLLSGLAGESKSAVTLWRGFHTNFSVEAGKTATVPVLMTKLATMTCTRAPLGAPRLFPAATQLADGRVLIAGGFYQLDDTIAGRRTYSATNSAEIYDPYSGTFADAGTMIIKRGLAQSALLGDGRVLIVGGAEELIYDAAYAANNRLFPLQPQIPVSFIEVYDPASNTFSKLTPDPAIQPALVFHTATALDDGRVLIAGGGTDIIASATTNRSILCRTSNSDVVCTPGPAMARYRIGHTATLLDDGRVFFWGGSTDSGPAGDCSSDLTVQACPEWFRPGQDVFVPVDTSNKVLGAGSTDNVFFATASRLTTDSGTFVMIAGGLRRDYNGTDLVFADRPTSDIRLYSPIENKLGAAAGNYKLRSERLFPTSAPLAWFGRAYVAGGYTSVTELLPARDMEVFDFGEGGIQPDIMAEGQPVLLRQARGGAVAVHVGASSVVLFGGEAEQGTGRTILGTAEIYTDKTEPQL